MKKITRFLTNNYHFIIAFFTLAVSLCISFSADLFGDDYFYMKPAVSSWAVILQFLKWHIMNCNGRTLVHAFIILFLRNKFTVTLWRILCGLGFTSLCFLISKLVFRNGNRYKFGVCVASFILMTIRTNMYNQSVYWLTGSFNYLFPLIFLLVIMLISTKNHNSKWLIPLAFLGGATMEQSGMMCIGWFVLLILDELIETRKINKNFLVCSLFSVAGYLTIVFSPGTFTRITTQSTTNEKNFATILLTMARKNWLDNVSIYVMISLLALTLCFWTIHFRKANKFSGIIAKFITPLFFTLFLMNSVLRVYLTLSGMVFGKDVTFSKTFNFTIMSLWLIYFALFVLLTAYSGVMIYLKNGESIPVVSLILGIDSQFMMVILKTVISRACFPAIIMFAIFLTYSTVYFASEFSKKKIFKLKHTESLLKAGVCVVCTVSCLFQLYSGVFGECLFVEEEKTFSPFSSEEMHQLTDSMEVNLKNYYSSEDSDLKIKYDAMDFSLYK